MAAELGVYVGAANTAGVNSYSTWLGKSVKVGLDFEDFTAGNGYWLGIAGLAWQLDPWSTWLSADSTRRLSLSVPMVAGDGSTLAQVAAGAYDTYFAQLSNNLMSRAGMNKTILRLGWEFNGNWYPWTAIGLEATFINAWKRIVDVIRTAQPTNQFKFDWCQAAGGLLSNSYPGDTYVDYIGLDAYDQAYGANTYPYPGSCDAACHTTRQNNAWTEVVGYLNTMRDFSIAHGKKMTFPEWGVWNRPDGHGGLDDPIYIQNMYDYVTNAANNMDYYAYFEFDAPDGQHKLSPTTQFPVASALYKTLFSSITPPPPPPPPPVAPSAKNVSHSQSCIAVVV